jgi:hypothetical protein
MGLLGLVALWAQRNAGGFQTIMGTAHIALGFRSFLLWYCHLYFSLIPGTWPV